MPDKTQEVKNSKSPAKTLGITVKKSENFSEWFTQVCSESGAQLADVRYGVQGFIVHRPWAMRILRKMYEEFEREVEADGHEPYLFPTVIPEENLLTEKEHAGFTPEVFWVEHAGDTKLERRVALRPTGETQIYPMYSLWIRSYKDLPWKGYQSRLTVFRNEMTTRPFFRGREFMFFETHDVFQKHEDALGQIKKDMGMMERVVGQKLKLPFVFFQRPKWDKFLGANDTFASDTLNPDGRRSQLSSTHDLGHNFAKPFHIVFDDENGKESFGWQTCFGPGIWRIMASLIAIHGDDQGLVLPVEFAPVQVVIVPILFANKPQDNAVVLESCEKVKTIAESAGLRVKLDTREESPGFKFNDWEMKGVPLRVEVGPKDVVQAQCVVVRRTDRKKTIIPVAQLAQTLSGEAAAVDAEISRRAQAYFADSTREAKDFVELKKLFASYRGFIKVPWCTVSLEGKKCAEILKAETEGGIVCGTPFGKEETPKKGSVCVVCNKPAGHVVWVAKSI